MAAGVVQPINVMISRLPDAAVVAELFLGLTLLGFLVAVGLAGFCLYGVIRYVRGSGQGGEAFFPRR